MTTSIFEYIALKNPNGAKEVINSFGSKAIRRPDILAQQLADTVNQHGKTALYRIAAVHPDLQLISHYNDHNASKKLEVEKKSSKSESDSIFSSAEGQAIKKAVEDISKQQEIAKNTTDKPKSEKSELLIIGAVVLIGLALVMKK